MMEYAKRAFHRSGIPLYLSVALCPLLNKAADEYSDIFTDGRLKVMFRVDNGEFIVDVINPAGSATVDGQSVGEAAMCGIIVAFSCVKRLLRRIYWCSTNPAPVLIQRGAGNLPVGC